MIHEQLKVTTLDRFADGTVSISRLPMPEWREYWNLIISEAKITPDEGALKELREIVRDQRKIFAHSQSLTPENAQAEHEKRREKHIEAIRNGKIPHDTAFDHSGQSVRHEFSETASALDSLLRRKAREHATKPKKFLKKLSEQIGDARQQMQEAEIAKAERWGVPFTPSVPLQVLASAEQGLHYCTLGTGGDENPTWSMLTDWLPPAWVEKYLV